MSSRFKDLWQHHPFFRFAIIAIGIFMVFLFVKKDNLITWVNAGITLNRQNRQIENYRQEIEDFDEKIRTITSNKDSLETYAREEFLFAEPGETVYIIEE